MLRSRTLLLRAASSTASAAAASSTPLAYETKTNPKPTLPLSEKDVAFFRENGYLVFDDVFEPSVLKEYNDIVRGAINRRGPKLVFPNEDSNAYEMDVRVQGKVDESKHQQQVGDKKKPKAPHQTVRMTVRTEKKRKRILEGVKRKMTRAKMHGTSSGSGSGNRADGADGDEVSMQTKLIEKQDADNMTTEEVEKAHDEFVRSDEFTRQVMKKSRIGELSKYFESLQRPWIHLWHGDAELSEFLTSGRADGPGRMLAQMACEASGCVRARLYSDRAGFRVAWGVAHALHCDQLFVDFNDYRGVNALVVLPDVELDRDSGGFLVLDGSHHIMRRLTGDATNASIYKASPAAWDFGDLMRKNPGHFEKCRPRHLKMKPGSVFLASTQLVYGQVPNFSCKEALTHTMTLMPDGTVHNGQQHSWLSKDKAGPLNAYKAGDPLNDDALFPMLYSALDDL